MDRYKDTPGAHPQSVTSVVTQKTRAGVSGNMDLAVKAATEEHEKSVMEFLNQGILYCKIDG